MSFKKYITYESYLNGYFTIENVSGKYQIGNTMNIKITVYSTIDLCLFHNNYDLNVCEVIVEEKEETISVVNQITLSKILTELEIIEKISDARVAFAIVKNFPKYKSFLIETVKLSSHYSYEWALKWPKEKDLVKQYVKNQYAILWAKKWPSYKEYMIRNIDEAYYIRWALVFPEYNLYLKDRIEDEEILKEWLKYWPNQRG